MSTVVNYIQEIYGKNDPRSENWFLVSRPFTLLAIILSYVYFCNKIGPQIMQDRKPFQLKKVLIVYNFIQVVLSAYLFREGLLSGWLHKYEFGCQPVDYSDNPEALRMLTAVHLYFCCKLVELLDTVFFVLRKKQRQISFLHLYHHAMMPFCAWIGVRFVGGGHPTLLGLINAFVHIVMYTYYMLSAFGPEIQKYLWWKKQITTLQIVQFIIIFVHNVQILFRDCNFPKVLAFLLAVNAGMFIYMFGSFYIVNYITKDSNNGNKKEATIVQKSNGITNGNTKINGYKNGEIKDHIKVNDKTD